MERKNESMIDQQPAQDDKTLAVLTHASGILFGFVVPLIIWLISKDTKPWLTAEAKEALNFQITVAIAFAACMVGSFLFIGAVLIPFVWLLNVIFCIIAALKTNQGQQYRYPFALRLIK
jgi:uncharacterized Tic20 family protein